MKKTGQSTLQETQYDLRGYVLRANDDALFDSGLISFTYSG